MKKIDRRIFWTSTTFFILYIKSLILTFMSASNSGFSFYGVPFDIRLMIAHLAILGIIIFPSLIFKGKASIRYLITINLIYSIFMIFDIWSYRGTGYLLELKYLFFKDGFNPLNGSIINPGFIDIVYIIDIPIMIFYCKRLKGNVNFKRNFKGAILGLITCITIIGSSHYLFDIKGVLNGKIRFFQEDWQASWSPAQRLSNRSPLGHHIYESYKTLKKVNKKVDYDEIKEIDEWLAWNKETVEDNEYKGIAKGKNIVFLQIESLENFVINQKVYNQEITPNMNEIIKKGLYFNNIHEQNNAGNSIDMDMMAASGILPLGDVITYLEYPEVKYKSFPRLLEEEGYNTILTHAERAGDWNWAEAGKSAAGYNEVWDIKKYKIDEYAGFGLSDRSLYTQFSEKISTLKEPFLAVVPTLTSHGPFDIDKKYRELNLPKELDENKLGGYFQSVNYADKQIGLFFKLLEQNNMLDNTIVVIYGDHGGVHKYYMEDIESTDMPGDWWQAKDNEVPLIIYGKDIPSKTISTYGGQIDIVPTVSYLLGIDTKDYYMGRNLLTSKRNASVIKGGIVVGNPSKEEEIRLKQAYDIADKIIKNNYYVNTNKVK
jgi:lipoteichoic acid synthase